MFRVFLWFQSLGLRKLGATKPHEQHKKEKINGGRRQVRRSIIQTDLLHNKAIHDQFLELVSRNGGASAILQAAPTGLVKNWHFLSTNRPLLAELNFNRQFVQNRQVLA